MKKTIAGRIAAPLFLVIAGAMAGEGTLQPLEQAFQPQATAPSAATARPADQRPPLRVRVTSPKLVILSSTIAGKINDLPVRDGDEFKSGDTLMVLDDSLHQIQKERASAMLNRHDLVYAMYRDLADRQSKGETEVEVARADREQAAAELRHTEAMLDRHRLTAPFDGRVTEVFVREQQYVGEGQPVLQVVDESDLALEFIMSSSWMKHYPVGHSFPVKIHETGKSHDATIERYGGRVDPVSQSVKVYARIQDTTGLMEGMSGEAILPPPAGETAP
ncbi:MAG: efflux RND transporter periplasmic adaptor subunit [Planctomycetes bacterium]|nr:efflux RND transporter periplasmic adaptor subunit [Planctomycetota bacterium]